MTTVRQEIKGYHYFRGNINGVDLADRVSGNDRIKRFRFKKEAPYRTSILGTSYTFSRVLYYDYHDEEGVKHNGIKTLSRRALQVCGTDQVNGWEPAEVVDNGEKNKERIRPNRTTRYRIASKLENAALAFRTTHAFGESRVLDWDYKSLIESIARLAYEGLMVVRRNGKRLTIKDLEMTLGIASSNGNNGKLVTSSS